MAERQLREADRQNELLMVNRRHPGNYRDLTEAQAGQPADGISTTEICSTRLHIRWKMKGHANSDFRE